jgi:hypothetical protein
MSAGAANCISFYGMNSLFYGTYENESYLRDKNGDYGDQNSHRWISWSRSAKTTIYIHPEAPINTISCDEHVEVYLYDAEEHNDVNSGNWGDEDVNPWANVA